MQPALKILSVVINICNAASESTRPPLTLKSQALALFAALLSREGGVAPSVIPALDHVWSTYAREKRVKEEKVAALQSHLALANAHLLQGKVSILRLLLHSFCWCWISLFVCLLACLLIPLVLFACLFSFCLICLFATLCVCFPFAFFVLYIFVCLFAFLL